VPDVLDHYCLWIIAFGYAESASSKGALQKLLVLPDLHSQASPNNPSIETSPESQSLAHRTHFPTAEMASTTGMGKPRDHIADLMERASLEPADHLRLCR
jgi:hypothetical protein